MEEKFETIQDKKLEAKRLYIIKELSGKTVCKIVGISEKTMSTWVTKGNWKHEKEQLISKRYAEKMDEDTLKFKILTSFLAYIKVLFPELAAKIEEILKDYLKRA